MGKYGNNGWWQFTEWRRLQLRTVPVFTAGTRRHYIGTATTVPVGTCFAVQHGSSPECPYLGCSSIGVPTVLCSRQQSTAVFGIDRAELCIGYQAWWLLALAVDNRITRVVALTDIDSSVTCGIGSFRVICNLLRLCLAIRGVPSTYCVA